MADVQAQQDVGSFQAPSKVQQQQHQRSGPAWSLLNKITGRDLVGGRKVFSLKPDTTTEEAVKILVDNRIHSAPVADMEGKCSGLVDFMDLLFWTDSCSPQDDRPDFTRQRHDEERVQSAHKLKSAHVSEIINFSGNNPLVSFHENESCEKIAEKFVQGIERAVLLDESGRISGFITQSDLIRYLYQNLDNPIFKDFKNQTLGDLGFVLKPLDMVSENESLKDALRCLHRRGGGAVPVVDSSTGKLMTHFSASDIKGIFSEETPHYTQTILGYLRRYNPRTAQSEPKHVNLNTSISELMRVLTLNKIHNVWTINSEGAPIGIVSMKDCLSLLLSPQFMGQPSQEMPLAHQREIPSE